VLFDLVPFLKYGILCHHVSRTARVYFPPWREATEQALQAPLASAWRPSTRTTIHVGSGRWPAETHEGRVSNRFVFSTGTAIFDLLTPIPFPVGESDMAALAGRQLCHPHSRTLRES
jgi:hypothetical protein